MLQTTSQPVLYQQSHANLYQQSDLLIDVSCDEDKKTYVFEKDPTAQRNFLLKVYGVLITQFVVTTALIAVNLYVPTLRVFNHQYFWIGNIMMVSSMIFFVGTYFGARIFPLNITLLAVFTIVFGWSVGMFCSLFGAFEVITAAALTAILVVCLSGYVLVTNARFHWMGMGLGLALFGLSLTTLVTLLSSLVYEVGKWWLFGLSGFGATLMALFILYDTSRILHDYTTEDVIPAAITLYTDILNLFVRLLSMSSLRG
jgi:FtsH-binding integral membrane protein